MYCINIGNIAILAAVWALMLWLTGLVPDTPAWTLLMVVGTIAASLLSVGAFPLIEEME